MVLFFLFGATFFVFLMINDVINRKVFIEENVLTIKLLWIKKKIQLDKVLWYTKNNLSNIKIKYRVKDPIFVLPHNYIFRDAVNSGSVIDFFYRNIAAYMRDYNGYFIAQTNEIVEKIL